LDDFESLNIQQKIPKIPEQRQAEMLPEISNLSLLWKLFAPSIIRRKKLKPERILSINTFTD